MSEPTRIDRIAKIVGVDAEALVDDPAVNLVDEQQQRRHEILTELWERLCPRRFQSARIAELDNDLRAELGSWVAAPRCNIVLVGPVGTGKTHALWAIIRELHYRSVRWSGGSVPDLLDSLRPERQQRFDPGADVVMLDDLGAERQTEWTAEQLTRIIDSAWNDERPIVASTNLAPETLAKVLGDRAWSRLAGGALVLGVTGGDRRFK